MIIFKILCSGNDHSPPSLPGVPRFVSPDCEAALGEIIAWQADRAHPSRLLFGFLPQN